MHNQLIDSQYYNVKTNYIEISRFITPIVNYGLSEAQSTGYYHAMKEIAMISYLMGMGYDMWNAHNIVESWEINEQFPTYYGMKSN